MLDDVPTLAHLLKVLQQIPCLASKNIYRVAAHFLTMDRERLEHFCGALLAAKERVHRCPTCCVWQEAGRNCFLCSSPKRDQSTVCVVESWHEVLLVENTGGYEGVYHVLGGLLCPLEGIGPDDIALDPLVARVSRACVKEVILALSQTPEGKATSGYIAHKLKGVPVILSCLACGIPVGASVEYTDRLTLYNALSERRPF